ncbi:MAG TPA: hypothetical protein VNA87_04120, partial [Actinomycetota bacterium]|nr:hypothetical protein [Actinomycetota bacterium]
MDASIGLRRPTNQRDLLEIDFCDDAMTVLAIVESTRNVVATIGIAFTDGTMRFLDHSAKTHAQASVG